MHQQRVSFSDALGHGMADKRIDILRQIGVDGSISQAARAVGVSYKAAWQALDTLTNLAGVPLVERAVGGVGGGGTQLSAAGRQLLEAAHAMEQARRAVLERLDGVQRLNGGADGGDGADGQGWGMDVARLSVRTSMRNQWPCVVHALEPAGAVVRVHLRGAGPTAKALAVCARITRESAELLALRPGSPVLAMCKATAVRVESADLHATGPVNRWTGAVTRVERSTREKPAAQASSGSSRNIRTSVALHDAGAGPSSQVPSAPPFVATRNEGGVEVSAQLDAGVQMVGFAAADAAPKARSRVVLSVDESAVVLVVAG